ncbi:Wzz/FepE/Etk N-terminal domain-containing protein [Peristeroidobacter agariperforans]|uniref:Wzz/FepE/Etk N-terminal domain-containing protein n=1 Tax=Peristeroidobacter agariperforans TaxID=268404 RepID=UPI00101C845C|nr:Wzz/FepE/Etk N-terminal domain-containing protein [Peristeroidobacter agariperforans]
MQPSEVAQPVHERTLDVFALVRLLLRHWILVGACVLVGGVVAVTFAVLAEPRYRSEAVLSVRQEDMTESALAGIVGQFGGLAQMAGMALGKGATADQAVAVLQSWSLAQDFIEQHGMLEPLTADARTMLADVLGLPKKNLSIQRAVKHFRKKILSVRRDKQTGLITVSVVWTDPVQAEQWVNDFIHMGDSMMRARAQQDAERSLALLKDELAKNQEVAIRAAVAGLVEAEMKRKVFAQARNEFALQVLDRAHASDPRDSVYPRRAWVLLAGLVAGGLLALLIIFVRERPGRGAASST